MHYEFAGKTALVSGGSRGIGRAIARGLVEGAASVAFAGRTRPNVDRAVDELTELAARAGADAGVLGIAVDLVEAAGVQRLVDATLERFGGVDILINNVGASGYGLFLDLDDEAFVSAWTLKALNAIRLTRALVPSMEARGGGAIVNIGGTAGREPTADGIPAALANTSIRAFTKGAAADLAPRGIAINSIAPWWVTTDRHLERAERQSELRGEPVEAILRRIDATVPTGHTTTVEDVAELALFLASRRVHNLTGVEIVLDGGVTRAL
jgi:3-oxoacyl-[acyl-carrier protein] reductase